jgi:anaerobic dimethyl sulfoxide reductase subunit B (iron-sulfur subunit)
VTAITKRADDGVVLVDQNKCIGCGFCAWACPFNAPQLSATAGKMEKCNFCQTPGKERPLDMPRACEEICPTGAIKSGSMADLANQGRERAAARLSGADMQGFPGMIVGAQQQFGGD